MLRRFLALVVLVALVGVAFHLWRDRGHTGPLSATERLADDHLGDVSRSLQDKKTTVAVKTAMSLSRTLHALPIEVEARGGTIVLAGRTATGEQRTRAEETARAVPDVDAVRNELQVDPSLAGPAATGGRTIGETLDDQALEAKVRLAWSLNRGMEGSDIDVRAFRRTLTLSGEAVRAEQKQLAVRLAEDVADATSVTDQIAVRGGMPAPVAATLPPAGLSSRAQETERALRENPSLAAFALRVREAGGIIRIEGRVGTAAEKDLASYVARSAAPGAAIDNAVQTGTGAPSN